MQDIVIIPGACCLGEEGAWLFPVLPPFSLLPQEPSIFRSSCRFAIQGFVFMPGKLHRAEIQEVHPFGKQEGCDLGKERQQQTDRP